MVSFALLIFAAAFGIKPLGGFFNFVGVGEFSCFIGECAFWSLHRLRHGSIDFCFRFSAAVAVAFGRTAVVLLFAAEIAKKAKRPASHLCVGVY